MTSKTLDNHESEKIHAEIAKLMAETSKISAETSRINAELSKLSLDSKKTSAETTKLYREIFWYPVAIASGFVGTIAAVTAIIIKLI
ncbi:hypothetical protein [Candidatus Regiella insecticola]|uniref:Uncharacterized protein n=1 Tax=Candidatus Regiella insecticola TaxID=138073 RepID=A0A6L2ZKL8_9ENTR|nr:hypothetical protein [Candidatus Regiella insecticola]GFN45373.1 uncharacterized protein RINTU1_04860 [Candidatus Regiella insecticola]